MVSVKVAVKPTVVTLAIGAAGFWVFKALQQRSAAESAGPSFVGKYGQDAPGIHIRFDLSPAQIREATTNLIEQSQRVHDRIAAVPLDEVSFESVIAPLARLEAEQFAKSQACEFPGMVSASKAVRDASTEAEKRLDAASVKFSMRQDVYQAVKAFANKREPLEREQQRYVDRLVRDFERNGLNLGAETRAEVERIKTRIGELCITFNRTLTEENTVLHFPEEQLAGLPQDVLQSLKTTADGRKEITLKYPHYFPVMKLCKVGSTRRAMEAAFNRRCLASNAPLLEEVAQLRHQMARLLGYQSHADYVLAIRMAKSPAQVKAFLEGVSEKISPLAAQELQRMRDLKRAEEGDGEFTMADFRYYMNQAEEQQYQIDHEKLREYFHLEVVTEGLMKIYQQLLGLQFEEVPEPHAWHSDVQLFRVKDAASGHLMGYFYLDLLPREGKYGHACVAPLQPGCDRPDGTRQLPVAAMLANFTKPANGRPSLLQHSEVVTYFHEFGHVMHNVCAHAKFAKFAGTRVERDFVEAPSQMLENWCWEAASLKLMSGHYEDPLQPIPEALCQTLVATKKAHAGMLTKRQLLFGLFDQALHTLPKADTAALLQELHPKVMLGIPMTEHTNMAASFSHLTSGYDASYYGYMWSEVFSADMFGSKFSADVLSPAAGKEYREKVLRPGGTRDAAAMLRDFLGRDPSEDAFLESKGLVVSANRVASTPAPATPSLSAV